MKKLKHYLNRFINWWALGLVVEKPKHLKYKKVKRLRLSKY